MIKSILIDQSTTADGNQISLHRHDGDYAIRVDGQQLMSTRQHFSEEELGRIVCDKFRTQDVHVLIGGLGFGYTLGAVLKALSEKSRVTVVELMPKIISWNQDRGLPLACRGLGDPRVTIVNDDVGRVIRRHQNEYHGIILDVDNGPAALTTRTNHSLYSRAGLDCIRAALKSGGCLGIWSVDANPVFEKQMKRAGFRAETVRSRSRPDKGARHSLFIGRT